MATNIYKVGQTIETKDGRQGIVRYIGTIHIAAGQWLGLELPHAEGKNDGSVRDERYFTCEPSHGIFVRKEAVAKVLKQSTTGTVSAETAKPDARMAAPTSTRPRPTNGITADVARKRQSLMSAGSQGGSRLSMRSPTKSPTKLTRSPASSTTSSTPRTTTPATTTRISDSSAKSRLSMSAKPSITAAPLPVMSKVTRHTSRPSIGGQAPVSKSVRPALGQSRPSLSAPRQSLARRPPVGSATSVTLPERDDGLLKSPVIDEEADGNNTIENLGDLNTIEDDVRETDHLEGLPMGNDTTSHQPEVAVRKSSQPTPTVRTNMTTTVESRAAQQKEVEQMKVKIRTLEKQRQEDHDTLKQVESLRSDKARYENIIQALQKKLKVNQQELTETRTRCEKAESKAAALPERTDEMESELELATLDKEMAEERAENCEIELEALRAKHEELELEVEILREENRELGSTISPEERASAGFLQMERENDRLRQALILLRDITQQNEGGLKSEIKELRESLDETEITASKYNEIAERLTKTEDTNRHLMEQLEAVETNEEVVDAMELQREQHMSIIEHLKKQVQDLEEHIQVTDELETYHVDEEKRLLSQLDESEALLNERDRMAIEQSRVIEDLEYMLTKFRDVVQGLQSDINDLRRSRDISETEAHEMTSKSRAMMDLNLKLQSSAAKTQTKVIDIELMRAQAELKNKQADILALFVPESFESERNPVLALLAFGRTRAKSALVSRLLLERFRERAHLSSGDDLFSGYEIMEQFEGIAARCGQLESYMSSCSAMSFVACGQAVSDLEPVERTVTGWVEALRKDELASDSPEYLKRMQGILIDLSEKLIEEKVENQANTLIARSKMIERYADSTAAMLAALIKIVQERLGQPEDDDEHSRIFDKRMDQISTKARTVSYLCSKVTHQLNQMRAGSLCPAEPGWRSFEDTEIEAQTLAQRIRELGVSIVAEMSDMERDEPLSYASIIDAMTKIASTSDTDVDIFENLASHMQVLLSQAEAITNLSSDTQSAIEFGSAPPPWTIRAKEIKAQKIIPAEVQEQLSQFQHRNTELGTRVMEKEKIIEEMTMRVELAEKRMKDIKVKDQEDKALREKLEQLTSIKQTNEIELRRIKSEVNTVSTELETTKEDLDRLRQAAGADGAQNSAQSSAKIDETTAEAIQAQVNILNTEISSLQATIRHLSQENIALRIPVQESRLQAAKLSWLDPNILRPRPDLDMAKKTILEKEAFDVWDGLINVAKTTKPLRLQRRAVKAPLPSGDEDRPPLPSSWRSTKDTSRFQVLKQREGLESWEAWRGDFVTRARMASRGGSNGKMRKGHHHKPHFHLPDESLDDDPTSIPHDTTMDGFGIVAT